MRIAFRLTCLFVSVALAAAVLAAALGESTTTLAAPLPATAATRDDKRSDDPKEDVKIEADNSACFKCHDAFKGQPLVVTHAEKEVGCIDCHGESQAHRNDENNATPPDKMYAPEDIDKMCGKCHLKHKAGARQVIARWQQRCPEKTDPEKIVCTNCHFQHRLKVRTVIWNKKTGKLVSGGKKLAKETPAPAYPPFGPNSPDEPIRGQFSMDAAVRFFDAAALGWQKQRKCFACHSDYAFFYTRPLVSWKTPLHEQLRAKLEHLAENPRKVKYQVTEAVMAASMLAQNDALTTGKLHPITRRALDRIWTVQRQDGGFDWMKYDQPPSEMDDHYGATVAVIGVGAAPDAYADTPAAKAGLDRIREYFKNNPPANLHHRAMKLLGSLHVDGIMTEPQRQQVVHDLFALQKPDGGWGLATMGENWERSDDKEQNLKTSDGYGTGFAVYVLRKSGIPAEEPRIQKGITWLKTHQRASGRWFTRSLWKDQKHYLTHAGTAYAILALAACGEIRPNDDHKQPHK